MPICWPQHPLAPGNSSYTGAGATTAVLVGDGTTSESDSGRTALSRFGGILWVMYHSCDRPKTNVRGTIAMQNKNTLLYIAWTVMRHTKARAAALATCHQECGTSRL